MRKILISFLLTLIGISSVIADGYDVGDYVSDFNLKSVNGEMVSLDDYNDAKGFIVIFTCNTCPYAQKYEQRIIELHEKFDKKGFPVIAINPNDPAKSSGDSYAKMKKRSSEKNYPFHYLQDVDQTVARKYGATRTPQTYLLVKEADKYKLIYTGAIDDNYSDANQVSVNYISSALDAYQKGEKVKNETTKAIGCTIKWKS